MYQFISGKLIEKTATHVVIETGGIGFFIHIPVSTFSELPELGAQARILTHFLVREDVQALYGFYSEEERQIFRMLLSVSGIGPKTAMTVLSGLPLREFKKAILDGNLVVLSSVPGIGRKTAERLVLELREKVSLEEKQTQALPALQQQDALVEDSLRALVELGYKKSSAQVAIQKAMKQLEMSQVSVPDIIRASLKYVS